jgi:hypothetical protein
VSLRSYLGGLVDGKAAKKRGELDKIEAGV